MHKAVERRLFLRRMSLLLPAILFIVLLMGGPMLLMAYVSLLERGTDGGVVWGQLTGEAYAAFLFEESLMGDTVLNTDYLTIYARSFGLSAFTVVATFIVGFPTALYIVLQPVKRRNWLMFMITIPFWTNLLVRNYAWILVLRANGLLDSLLQSIGLTSEPLGILYSPMAVAIGLTYSFLPLMILPIYASLEKLDFSLVEAAFDLGANRIKSLIYVIIPSCKQGIIAGSILVFVPGLGSYITPTLLGGSKSMMIGNLIQSQFGAARNWPLGAALSFVLLAIVIFALVWQARREADGSNKKVQQT